MPQMEPRAAIRQLWRGGPDVAALLERGDLEGLIDAAKFEKPRQAADGRKMDKGVHVREQAILALGQIGLKPGRSAVLAALRDPEDAVRSAAVRVLSERGDVLALARSLGALPPGRALALAVRAIMELRTTPVVRATAASLIHRPGEGPLTQAEVEYLLRLTQSDSECRPLRGVVRELLNALRTAPNVASARAEDLLVRLAPQSTPIIIAELERGAAPARSAAVLGRIGDAGAVEPLVQALDHPTSSVRVEAARSLGMLRDTRAVEPLLGATRDPIAEVRSAAARALDDMGTAAIIVGVTALLREGHTNGSAPAVDHHRAQGVDQSMGARALAAALDSALAGRESDR